MSDSFDPNEESQHVLYNIPEDTRMRQQLEALRDHKRRHGSTRQRLIKLKDKLCNTDIDIEDKEERLSEIEKYLAEENTYLTELESEIEAKKDKILAFLLSHPERIRESL